jgi:hypothetical protein
MVDLRVLGREGLIIEYTDIVSLVGYNIIKYLKSNNIKNDKIQGMSNDDILLSYVNRTDFNIAKWIKDTFNIECDVSDYLESEVAFKPNNVYAFKMFSYASKEHIKNLYIYSDKHSPIIEKNIKMFNVPELKYIYGDILPILNEHPNSTLTTSNPYTIKRCYDVKAPTLITLVDDFMYVGEIIDTHLVDRLRGTNKIVMFTSISSNGI